MKYEDSEETFQYIYFLQLTKKLPEQYFVIGKILREQYKITLVAIQIEDYLSFKEEKRKVTLVLNSDFQTKSRCEILKKKYFEYALAYGKILLLEISSFSPMTFNKTTLTQNFYHHMSLPCSAQKICRKIASVFYKQLKVVQGWPGGKRSTLPKELVKQRLQR